MPLIAKVGRNTPKMRLMLFGIAAFLWLGIFIKLFQLWWMFASSIKPAQELFVMPPTLWPENPTLIAYKMIFGMLGDKFMPGSTSIWVGLKNSCILTGGYLALMIPVTSLAAYSVSKLHSPRWARLLFLFFIGTMMIPDQVKMIPTYMLIKFFPFAIAEEVTIPLINLTIPSINLTNTYLAIILPGAYAAFNFLIFKGFFDSVPDSIINAARVDGGSEFNIFRKIVMPMMKSTLAVVTYLGFLAQWNNFMGPLIYLTERKLHPISLMLYHLQQRLMSEGLDQPALMSESIELMNHGISWNGLMAAALIDSIPVVLMFIIFREFIVKGVKLRGFK